jgi:hypothetical protein
MNRYMLTNVFFNAMLLAAIPIMARGQQCPDWSPEFDQIDDPVALQQLQQGRSEGWPNLNPLTNGGISIQQGIQSLDQSIQQYQQQLQQAEQAYMATRSSNTPMPKMNGTECRNSNNMGAAMAAACEVDNMHNAILAAQGTIDLARCRAGMPAVSHSSFDSMGSGTPYTGGGFGSYAASFNSGAASEAGLNVSKRSGMVNLVTKSWHPPAEQQQAQDSLAQSTTLADPFAEPEVSDGGTAASANQGTSGNAASSNASNSDDSATSANATNSFQSSDSSVADSGTGNSATSSADVAAAMPSQAETSVVPDSGTPNNSDSSVIPAAEIPEVSNSSDITNSGMNSRPRSISDSIPSAADYSAQSQLGVPPAFASDSSSGSVADSANLDQSDAPLDQGTEALRWVNNKYNENSASKYVTDQGLQQVGAQFQQGFKPIDDATATGIFSTDGNAGYNATAVQQFNFDSNSLGVASVEAVLPGAKYLQAIPNDLPAWRQAFQNMGVKVKTNIQSYFNYFTSNPDCTQLFSTDPRC